MKPQPRRDEQPMTEAEARAMVEAWEREPPIVPEHFDPADDEASMRRGEADFAAGRFVDRETVSHWLKTWGSGEIVPRPKCPGE
jgi:hypothetical protein